MNPRKTTLKQTFTFTPGGTFSLDLPQDGPTAAIEFEQKGNLDVAGGAAAGTAKSWPLPPFGAFALDLVRQPETKIAPIANIEPVFWHLCRHIVMPGRVPPRTVFAGTPATAAQPSYGSGIILLSLLRFLDTLYNGKFNTAYKIKGTWPATANALRDSLRTGCDGAVTVGADPFRLEFTPHDYILMPGEKYQPAWEVGFRREIWKCEQAADNLAKLNVQVGEKVGFVIIVKLDQNGARADVATGGKISFAWGTTDPIINETANKIQRENADQYGIPDGSWLPGFHVLDLFAHYKGGVPSLPLVADLGSVPIVNLNENGVAPAAGTTFLTFSMILRPAEKVPDPQG